MFELLLTSPRPVQLHEVQGVLSYKLEDHTMNFESRKYVGDFKELCGPIVDVVGETIDLVHYTAKRYGSRKPLMSLGTLTEILDTLRRAHLHSSTLETHKP